MKYTLEIKSGNDWVRFLLCPDLDNALIELGMAEVMDGRVGRIVDEDGVVLHMTNPEVDEDFSLNWKEVWILTTMNLKDLLAFLF